MFVFLKKNVVEIRLRQLDREHSVARHAVREQRREAEKKHKTCITIADIIHTN